MAELAVSQEVIQNNILVIRGVKVILDRDLAKLYGVETKLLTRQVRRNRERFPEEFLRVLTPQETSNLKRHFGTSSWGGTRKPPLAFTEHGILCFQASSTASAPFESTFKS